MPILELEGVPFYFEEQGAGPPLLLIAGTGGHTGTFSSVAERLSDAWRVISYDRRGFGQTVSPPMKAGYLHRHADDAAALLRALGAVPATVVGWSFGGLVALALAVRHPASVARLVLYEPPLHAKQRMGLAMAAAVGGAILLGKLGMHRRGAERFHRWALGRRDGTNALDELDPMMRESLLANARASLAELEAGTGEELTAEHLRGIACPVGYVLTGQSQPVFEEAASRFCSAVPSTSVVRVADGDHVMNVLQPEQLTHAIRDAARSKATP